MNLVQQERDEAEEIETPLSDVTTSNLKTGVNGDSGEVHAIALEVSEAARARVRAVWKGTFMSGASVGALVLALRFALAHDSWMEGLSEPWVLNSAFMAAMLTAVSWPVMGMIGTYRARRKVRAAAEALARSGDRRTIGALVDLLGMDDPGSRTLATDALILLLPTVKHNERDLLTAQQRQRLTNVLWRGVDNPLYKEAAWPGGRAKGRAVDFRLAILKAYEQIGDSRALPQVERLAAGPARSTAQRAIKQAAEECLPHLAQLAARERESRSLLRPSTGEQSQKSSLLRPASGVAKEDTELLLRADGEP